MRTRQKIINLYGDSSVRSIKQVVSIGTEEDLNQFWHYFHNGTEYELAELYNFIGHLYAFVSKQFEEHEKLFFELIIEESEECFYFTVWNAKIAGAWSALLEQQHIAHRRDRKRTTVRLEKAVPQSHPGLYDARQEDRRKKPIDSVGTATVEIQPPYAFLDPEDREEVLRICEDLTDVMYRTKHAGVTQETYIRLRSCFSMLSLQLHHYRQLSHVATLITEFSMLMNTHQERFKSLRQEEMALIGGFVHNIDRWANVLFVIGGADLHFMDNSLNADLTMVKMLISPPEYEAMADLNEIFDF